MNVFKTRSAVMLRLPVFSVRRAGLFGRRVRLPCALECSPPPRPASAVKSARRLRCSAPREVPVFLLATGTATHE